jgi:hypothetical protein
MGGSSSTPQMSTSFLGPMPPAGRPLDFNALLGQASTAQGRLLGDQNNFINSTDANRTNNYQQLLEQQLRQQPGLQLGIADSSLKQQQGLISSAQDPALQAQRVREFTRQQTGLSDSTMRGVFDNLANSDYLRQSEGALGRAGAIDGQLADAQNRIGGVAARADAHGHFAWQDANATAIEDALVKQGEADLALGRSLSPEQQRQAEQQARAAMQARGLATSNAGAAAEILNRDAYGQQREDSRRAFAASANNLRSDNMMSRRKVASDIGATTADMYNTHAGIGTARAGLSNQLAGSWAAIDPYSRMYQLGTPLATSLTGNQANFARGLAGDSTSIGLGLAGNATQLQGLASQGIGNAFSQWGSGLGSAWSASDAARYGALGNSTALGLDLAGNVASFNSNRADSMYNNWLNAQAGLQSANMQASAAGNAANTNFWGSLGGSALGAAGLIFSDRRLKRDVKEAGTLKSELEDLPVYDWRYKDDGELPTGWFRGPMAQDVQKVLPEAVQEVRHKGKKRLAIRPAVIAEAMAA